MVQLPDSLSIRLNRSYIMNLQQRTSKEKSISLSRYDIVNPPTKNKKDKDTTYKVEWIGCAPMSKTCALYLMPLSSLFFVGGFPMSYLFKLILRLINLQ